MKKTTTTKNKQTKKENKSEQPNSGKVRTRRKEVCLRLRLFYPEPSAHNQRT